MLQSNELIWNLFDRFHTDFPNDTYDESIASMEKFNPARFYRENHVFRIGHFGARIVELGPKTELPTGAILHILDDAAYPNEHQDTPRIEDNVFVQRESFRRFIFHVRDFNLNGPIMMEDKYVYRQSGLPSMLMRFRSKYGSFFKYVNSIAEMPTKKECLVLVNHNPLFRARLFGRMQFFRKTQLILASILNTVHQLTSLNKQQYILIPWGEEVYDKQMFTRSRIQLNMATVKRPESFHYIVMMHLMNFMWDKATTSIFDQLPEEDLRQINIILQLNNKYVFYNLQDLKDLNVKNKAYFRFANQLNLLSILGRVTESTPEEIKKVIDTHFEQTSEKEEKQEAGSVVDTDVVETEYEPKVDVDPKVDTEETVEEKVEAVINKVAPIVPLSKPKPITTSVSTEIPQVDPIVREVRDSATVEVKGTQQINSTSIKTPSENTDAFALEFLETNEQEADTFIEEREDLTPKEKERYKMLSRKYKNLELDGERLEDILLHNNDLSLEEDVLDEKVVGYVPDPSALKSSLVRFDENYMKKTFNKHLVGVVTSFQKNGVYLTGIKSEKIVTEMNNVTQYTLKYEDIEKRQSTIKFRIPTVDKEGKVLIDGVKQVLKKQRVNLPIVKISDTEVSLASNQNKTRVERNINKAHNYFAFIDSMVNSPKSHASIEFGSCRVNLPLSYEYSSLAERYKGITFSTDTEKWELYFDYVSRLEHFGSTKEKLESLEQEYGVYFGRTKQNWLFIDNQNIVRAVAQVGGEAIDFEYSSIYQILRESLREGESFTKALTEWVSIKILDKQLPVIFVLAYRYGLRNILDYIGIRYTITARRSRTIVGEGGFASFGGNSDTVIGVDDEIIQGDDWIKIAGQEDFDADQDTDQSPISEDQKYKPKLNDIAIKFADRILWFNRYPLAHSLLVAGLDYFDLSSYELAEFESKDIYYQLLLDKRFSHNLLKGIDAFYDLFIDNMTFTTLKMMKEPTNVRDLLIRCAVLLSTLDYRPPSSRQNHRIRGYEQFNAILYNEMARQFATYKSHRGKANVFSINPDAVFLRIIQNASMVPSESANPLQDIKEMSYMTYSGVGGRTSDSFVVNDRKLASDDIGVISEATVDNQKVGINAQLSLDPGIVNTMGVLEPSPLDELQPANVLSAHALVFPFSTNDDSKRINFISTQSTHWILTKAVEQSRVRTGYERIVAHRSGRMFAGIAEQDGKITNIDEKSNLIEMTYEDGTVDVFRYGEQYTEFQGFHVSQDIKPVVELGQKLKKGEVVTYNTGYFTRDETTGQLDLTIGVLANVALLEYDTTLEDSTEISQRLSEKLTIRPTNTRIVTLSKKSIIHKAVSVGDEVLNTDSLMIFEEEPIEGTTVFNTDDETLALLSDLNKNTPTAKFNGKIVNIEAYYGCPISEMHPTLGSIVKSATDKKNRQNKIASKTERAEDFPPSGIMPSGSKYKGVTFDEDTVCLIFYIQEEIPHDKGDKLVFMNQLKCTCAGVFPKEITSESGVPIDAFFSCDAIGRRVVLSPILYGILARIMEHTESTAVDMYFN